MTKIQIVAYSMILCQESPNHHLINFCFPNTRFFVLGVWQNLFLKELIFDNQCLHWRNVCSECSFEHSQQSKSFHCSSRIVLFFYLLTRRQLTSDFHDEKSSQQLKTKKEKGYDYMVLLCGIFTENIGYWSDHNSPFYLCW